MRHIIFDTSGYKCFDEYYNFLFESENTHFDLFNYVEKDLSRLPVLMAQYVHQRIDHTTLSFECKILDKEDPGDLASEKLKEFPEIYARISKFHGIYNKISKFPEICEVMDTLLSVHPYYEGTVKEVIIMELGSYFNQLLIYLCYNPEIRDHKKSIALNFSKKWYIRRINRLLYPLLLPGDNYPEYFYEKYKEQIGDDVYVESGDASDFEGVIHNFPRGMPVCDLSYEINTQRIAHNMLFSYWMYQQKIWNNSPSHNVLGSMIIFFYGHTIYI